ncbi:MAG: TatD family hydrolase [Candidatus Thiodiazotropha endolucinida]|nr:TatD family hydrolase [Candidatus Thiodiazotropha taylori]MCW4345284.1 TatD family hydrolase [Candidatus Thiodiazotropha endolucinida]
MHAATHLPGIFDDQLEPTEELIRRRISALKICESKILGSVSDLSSLTNFVNDLRQIRWGQYHVSIQQSRAMAAMCQLQGDPVPEEFTLVPANSPAVLLHWRVLLVIVACLNDRDRQDLVERYPISAMWIEEESLPEGIDSHFHLDRTRRNLNKPDASVEEICKTIRPDRDFRFKLTGGIAVFCDPGTYPSRVAVQELKTQGFAVAIGMHPKYVTSYKEADFKAFQTCLTYPEVRAFGEVGLDYTSDPSTWGLQHVILDRVLKHLQPSHVLVLHARGMPGTQTGVGYYQLLYQLKGVVSSDQRIHLHCFEGSRELMEKWLGEFPNTRFGFTGLVKNFSAASREALRHVPEDKLLLETDSPYFHLGGRRHSSPALLGMVANLVADVRGQTWTEVLEVASRNASLLYFDN